jgi:hypothetical protein
VLGVLTKLATLAAVLVLALALGACGDDEAEDDPEAREALIAALSTEAFEGIESGVIDMGMEFTAEGDDGGELTATLSGPFSKQGQVDLDGTVKLDGQDQDLDLAGSLTVTEDNLYVGSGDNVYELGAGRFKELEAAQPQSPVAPTMGFTAGCRTAIKTNGGDPSVCDQIDPEGWIATASDEGTEEIDGVETQHLRGELDVEQLIDDFFVLAPETVPPGQADVFEQLGDLDRVRDAVTDAIDEVSIDAYRGTEDGLTRGIDFDMGLDAEGQQVDLGFDLRLEDLNQPQTITAPEGARSIESLRSQIPFFFQPLFDCFLEARTAADFNRCGRQAGGFGGGFTSGA